VPLGWVASPSLSCTLAFSLPHVCPRQLPFPHLAAPFLLPWGELQSPADLALAFYSSPPPRAVATSATKVTL
jgi:hypothetical protein